MVASLTAMYFGWLRLLPLPLLSFPVFAIMLFLVSTLLVLASELELLVETISF